MMSTNNICNTCANKRGSVLIAPISKKEYPCFSCKNFTLAEGYNYYENTCSNYVNEGSAEQEQIN